MNKKFIHEPKIKIISSEFRSSHKTLKLKNQKLHITIYKMSVPRSRSFLFFRKIKKHPI